MDFFFLSVSDTKRIAILGKTGAGKSSLANTILGEKLFMISDSPNSETNKCQAKNKSVNGQRITLIDTPGFFDTHRSEEELKAEIVRCITECSPGPHAVLIVLKVEKFTEQEQDIIKKTIEYFSEEVFKYATVLFTHGDQLSDGQTIMEFVQKNKSLSDLVKKCGGRCHVIDNKYWNNDQQDEYRSNKFQVEELLKTIDEITDANRGGCYTNEMLQAVEEMIQQEEERIRMLSPNMPEEENREQAKVNTAKKLWIKLAGIATGALLGALLGVGVAVVVMVLKRGAVPTLKAAAAGGAAVGTVIGGVTGYIAAENADSVLEGGKKAAKAVWDEAKSVIDKANDFMDGPSHPKKE
ncbi:GTPase IMAP family member 7-like [Centropristis striata]|uniref:GTPase IMAP family member 7-like n=1 Tax=Centropristis striata TaxID=184440 RepID=UPI0027DFBFDE|nr:GTPase IMAP family member 7-like [Centropristis striata]